MKIESSHAQYAKAQAATSQGAIAKKPLAARVDATVKKPRTPLK